MGIVNTYTPQGGYTPGAQGVQSMSDLLATVTGSPAAATLAAASQAGPDYGATPVPQLSAADDKIRALFARDQVLAQQQNSPNLYGGNGVPAPSTPGGILGQLQANNSGGVGDLQRIIGAMDFNQTRTADTYKNMLDALKTLATLEAEHGGSNGGEEDAITDAYLEQIKTGTKLTEIPAEYKNAVVMKMKQQGLTFDSIAKELEGKPIIQNISDLKDAWDQISPVLVQQGPIAKILGGVKQAATVFGYESELKTYNKKRDIMISSLRQLVKQGGNMSNRDMLRIENGLAKITDVPKVSNETWNEIVNTLRNTYGDDVVSKNFSASLPGTAAGGATGNNFKVTPL